MARNHTPRFMNLFSPARRSARTNRWRKRFQKFSLSSWQSSRVVESVCSMFRVGAEATRLVRGSVTSQIVMAGGGRSLQMEGLEQRAMLAADVYVDDDWAGYAPNTPIPSIDIDQIAPGVQPALFGTHAFAKIQEGVDAVDVNGTVHVNSGTYNEDVLLDQPGIGVIGAGSGTTTVVGPMGGDGATLRVAANGIEIAGLTITRAGNNTTDWNDGGLNSAGIAIQGLTITGAEIHDTVITGNRTGIDINNSNGHTIRNNDIVNNRTGLIFRNQTDNLTVEENNITDNWTVGVVFLDASSGSNVPVQTATDSEFNNNNISGNWYGQVVDRQTGGALPGPGLNQKDFTGNWFGTANPGATTANSAEPGYAAQIPVAFGGTAVAPPASSVAFYGAASANIDFSYQLLSGFDTNVETTPGRGTFGFQGLATPQVWVDNDWEILVDVGPAGLSPGDLVESDADGGDNFVTGKYFGYDAFDSLAAALAGVQAGGQINVLAGTFSGSLNIDKDVDIIGQSAALSILNSGLLSTPITVTNNAEVLVQRLTVAGGIFGVNVDGADVTIRESIVSGGSAIGILVDSNGQLAVVDSTLTGSGAGTGVAVIDGSASITGSILNGRTDGVIIGADGSATLVGNNLAAASSLSGKVIQADPAAGVINASGNYWGSTNENTIAGRVLGSVDFSPYLAGGTASGVGFAGDFSLVYVTTLGSHAEAGGRIQDGVDRVLNNGTVQVNAGSYTETVGVVGRTGVKLLGAGALSTTIAGPAASPSNSATIKVENSTGTEIDGFTITRTGNTVADWATNGMTFGVLLASDATSTTIENNILTGNRTALDLRHVGVGNNVIQDNDIVQNRTGVIIWDLSNNNTIERNKITDNFTVGVLMFDTSNEATGNVITNNAIAGNWYSQVEDRRPSSSAVRDFSGNWFGTNAIVTTTLGAGEPGYAALIPTIYGGSAVAPGSAKIISGDGANNVDYSPWLDSGTNLKAFGQLGFDGDFSKLHVDDASPQAGATGRITEGLNRLDDSPAPGTLIVHAGTYGENVDASAKAVKFELGTATAQVILNGNLALSADDTLVIELNGTSATSSYDNFVVNGSVALNGATLSLSRGFVPFPGDSFVIVGNDGADAVSGTFAGLAEGAVVYVAGIPLTLSYAGGDGNDVTLTVAPPSVVYVNDTWSDANNASGGNPALVEPGDEVAATGPGDVPVGGQLIFGYNAFASIQDAIDAVTAGGTVNVLAGTYFEQVVVDKSIDLLGPNAGLAGNAGGRIAEAIILPTDSSPDPNVGTSPTLVYVTANNVRIAGLSFDGDNPGLTSGTTLNGADLDAEEAIASYEGVSGITVENNIIRNFSYTGIDFYNDNNAGAATSGNVIRQNLIENLGAFGWGIGILVYNNFYADITDNVMNDVRVGVQTGNFYQANPGVTGSISGNTISASRAGVWNNLAYGSASPLTISGNTISADSDAAISRFSGIWVTSIATAASPVITGNTVTVGAVAQGQTVGYDLWNNSVSGGVTVNGGSVSGADYGVWINNFDSYPTATGSNGSSTSANITGVTISNAAIAGVYVKDNASNTNSATVNVNVTGSTITGSAIGVLVEGSDATATVTGNNFDGATDNATDLFIANGAGAVTIGAGNAFAGDTFFIDNQSTQSFDLSSNSTTFEGLSVGNVADNFRIEDKMYHRVDSLASGLITWVANNVYVTAPVGGSTDSSIQRGIDAAAAGNTVNVEAGTYDEALVIGKAITLRGSVDGGGAPATILRPLASVGNLIEIVSSTAGAVTIEDLELDGNNAGVRADYGIRINSGTTFSSLTLDNLRVKEFRNIGLSIDGNATGQSVDIVTLSNSVFTDNGDSGISGTGAISLFSFNESATLTNVDVTNATTARSGIQFRGAGSSPYLAAGTISLNNVDVSGTYQTQMIGIQRYNTTAGISFNNVELGGATSAITGGFGASLRFDSVGVGTLASPATLSLGNTTFRGLAPSSTQPHEIEVAPDNAFAFLRLDGTSTKWDFGGSAVGAGALTLSQLFAVEDRILHFVDQLHPTHGTYKGFVDIKAGETFVTEGTGSANPLVGDGSIQRAVDVVAAGGTVNVESGTFVENVTINKNVTLLSEVGRANTTIQGISGAGALGTIVITDAVGSTTDVNIGGLAGRGFTIVGIDNGAAGIENAAVYFQGNHSGAEIRSNDIVASGDAGLMTEFGRTITNFVIDNNIFSGQTFVGTPADNGFGNQFTTPNVPRQLVVMGSGAGTSDMSGLQFTNNQITGTAGGVNGGGEQGNSLVTIDGASTVITGNAFSGSTTRFGASLRARGVGNTISGNQFTSTGMGATTVDLYVNRTGNVITGNTFASSAGAAIQVDNFGGATIGGAGVLANSIANYGVGILVSGASAGAVVNANTITGSDVGVDVNAGTARVQGANLNGNTIGVKIQNGGIADLGQTGPGVNFTGLGISTGGNDFSGYTGTATATAGAIVNLNVDAVTGRQGTPPDVTAFGNTWAVNTPMGIEDVVYHDGDLNTRGFVDFAAFAFTGAVTVSTNTVNEGGSVTVSGSFSNTPQAHTVTINWGDGSAPTIINLAAGVYTFNSAPHTYEDDVDGPPTSSIFPVTVTITDASTASIVDSSNSVTVNNVTPSVVISGGTLAGDGQTLNFTYTTTDPGEGPGDVFALQGITVTTLTGGATGTLIPGTYDPSTGSGTFSVLFNAPPGSGTVQIKVDVADDDGAVGSDTHVVTVGNMLRVTNFVTTDSGFDVTFNRAINLAGLNLYDGVNPLVIGDALKAADIVVHAVVGNVDVKGSVVWNAATNTLSWVKTGGPLTADTYQITLVSGSDAFVDTFGNTLDGNNDFVAGGNYQQTVNKVVVGGTPIVSLPDFARAPGQAVDLTANNTLDTMLPVRATGVNVQGVNFELKYNPALLTINPLMVTPALVGWNVLASLSAPDVDGLVTLTVAAFSSAPGFAFSGTQSVVSIAAAVPTTAPFGAAQVLRLQNSEVNDDDAQNDAAIQKVAFAGDANGSGILSGSVPPSAYTAFDSTLIARVVIGQDTGFDAYPLIDPAIVGDASGNGGLNAFDASLVLQEASGANTPEVPDETAPGTGGFDPFDPLLSIGDYYVNLNGPVTIPVNIKIETTVVGIISSTYIVKYDTTVLDFVGAQLGDQFPAPGWSLVATETSPGVIQVAMFNTSPSTNFGGAVVELGKLNFQVVAANTGLVSLLQIDPVDPNESGLVWTKDDGSAISTFEADFDRDGDVDGADLAAWEAGYGTPTAATVAQGDADRNGTVDGSDFLIWQRQSGSVVVVPPATVHYAPASLTTATTELPVLSTQVEPAATPALQVVPTVQPYVGVSPIAASDEATATTIASLNQFASPLPSAAWWLASSTENQGNNVAASGDEFDWDVAFDEWSNGSDSNESNSGGVTAVASTKRKTISLDEVEIEEANDADSFGREMDEAILAWLES